MTFDNSSGLAEGATVTVASGAACNNWTVTSIARSVIVFSLSADFAPSGAVAVNGNAAIQRIYIQSDTLGTPRTLTVATLSSLTNTDFMDISGAGAAAPFSGTSIGDALGNSGITFTVSATQTFVGGTKSWSDATAWTSRVPLPQDDVVVNTTGAGTLTADMDRLGRNVDFTSFTRTLALATSTNSQSAGKVFGSLTFSTTMTVTTANKSLTLAGRSAGLTFTTGGLTMPSGTFTVAAPGATYTQSGALTLGSQPFTLVAGSYNDGGNNVTVGRVVWSGSITRTFTISGVWSLNVTGTQTVWSAGATPTNGTLNFTGTIQITSTDSGVTKTFQLGGTNLYTYDGTIKHVSAGSAALVLTGSATIKNLDLECTTARTITLSASGTQTITTALTLQGASGQVLTVQSSSGGTRTDLVVNSGATYTNSNLTRTSDVNVTLKHTVTAGVVTGGSATNVFTKVSTISGGIVLGGTRTIAFSSTQIRTGGPTLGGTATSTRTVTITTSGGSVLTGIASNTATCTYAPTAGPALTGTAASAKTATVTATGGTSLAGSATNTVTKISAVAGGPVLAGTRTTAYSSTLTVTGGTPLRGSAASTANYTNTATAGTALTGSATSTAASVNTPTSGPALGGESTIAIRYTATAAAGPILNGVIGYTSTPVGGPILNGSGSADRRPVLRSTRVASGGSNLTHAATESGGTRVALPDDGLTYSN